MISASVNFSHLHARFTRGSLKVPRGPIFSAVPWLISCASVRRKDPAQRTTSEFAHGVFWRWATPNGPLQKILDVMGTPTCKLVSFSHKLKCSASCGACWRGVTYFAVEPCGVSHMWDNQFHLRSMPARPWLRSLGDDRIKSSRRRRARRRRRHMKRRGCSLV